MAVVTSTTTNTVSGIKFHTMNDIPNLQLWLDPSQSSSVYIDGISDYNYHFDGSNRMVINNTSLWSLSTTDFTIEFYINLPNANRVTGTLSHLRIINFQLEDGSSSVFGINVSDGVSGDGGPKGVVWTTNGLQGTTNIGDGRWRHIAVVRKNGVMQLYVNGVQEGSSISYPNNIPSKSKILICGFYDIGFYGAVYGGPFAGNLSNLRIVTNEAIYSVPFVRPNLPLTVTSGAGITQLLTFTTNTLQNFGNSTDTITTHGACTIFDPYQYGLFICLDKSPNALTATQVTRINQPSISIVNGLSAMTFNGAGQFLTLSNPIQTSGNYTSFFVYTRPQNGIYSISLGNSVTDSESPYVHWSDNFVYSGNLRTNNQQLLNGVIVGAVRKNESLYLSGQQITPFATGWGGAKTGTVNSVGRYSNSHYHSGLFGEYIQTSSMLPDVELKLVSNVLTEKWLADPYLSDVTLSLNASTLSQATLYGNTTTSSSVTHYNSQSIAFDGSGDYLSVDRSAFPYTNPNWTFELWANFTDFNTSRGIATMPDLMIFEVINSSVVYFRWRVGSQVPGSVNGWLDINIPVSLVANQWYHLAISVSNFTMKVFVNGDKKTQVNIAAGEEGSGQNSLLYIGAADYYPFGGSVNTFNKGYMEDIRITSSARYINDFFIPPQKAI